VAEQAEQADEADETDGGEVAQTERMDGRQPLAYQTDSAPKRQACRSQAWDEATVAISHPGDG
jgi:hypothetical protein